MSVVFCLFFVTAFILEAVLCCSLVILSAGRHIHIFPTVFEGLSKFGENDPSF